MKIARGYWTPTRNELIKLFPNMVREGSAAVYMKVYDSSWRNPTDGISASLIARSLGMDESTVSECLLEQEAQGLVIPMSGAGSVNSTRERPWYAPLAKFQMAEGCWFPVPLFFWKYILQFADSIMLIPIVYHQHLSWNRHCWPGGDTLAAMLQWSEDRVYDAIDTMSDASKWATAGNALPVPMKVTRAREKWMNPHLSVRAMVYRGSRDGSRKSVSLHPDFIKYFAIPPFTSRRLRP